MRRSTRIIVTAAAGALALSVGTRAVQAQQNQLSTEARKCLESIAKSSGKFVQKKLKAKQKCIEANLKSPGACAQATIDATVAALVSKLSDGIAKKCGPLSPVNFGLGFIGYPGKCEDANPNDGFTLSDIQDCMHDSHEAAVDAMLDVEYGTTAGPITDSALLGCQSTLAKSAAKFLTTKLKAVQKCRNGLNSGKLAGFAAKSCATADSKTQATIAKAESKTRAKIASKCTDAQIAMLDVCNPNATTLMEAQDCLIATHCAAADDPAPTASDLIDFEYATPAVCGDNIINSLDEECDGAADAACSGQCGAANGNFACLCLNKPRERVIEHANSDLDNGWTGQSHDSGVVEGGGYVADLSDCNGTTDVDCTVGPSCSGGTHAACSNDAQCGLFGPCRKERTAVGPHCNLNVQTACTCPGGVDTCSSTLCPGAGNFCKRTFHGPPLPLSAGGISVCVLNIFSEDVVGTKNLTTGAGAVRLRQRSITHLTGTPSQPCPVCGGFCRAPLGGDRKNCSIDSDCPASTLGPPKCMTDFICSFGTNADQECRPDSPFGGPTALFGNPSVDCPPVPVSNISGSNGLDILFNPASTETVTLLPTVACDDPAFANKRCLGGANQGRVCTNDTECPASTCNNQCFCPIGGAQKQKPNDCDAACLGGPNDTAVCSVDSECPSGFCHPADCRLAFGSGGNDGGCTNTSEGKCSVSQFRSCSDDAQCQPPACTECAIGETCVITAKNCFVNSGIVRVGVADPDNPVSAAIFCIAATNTSSVDSTAGLPGPGAIIQPSTTVKTGIP